MVKIDKSLGCEPVSWNFPFRCKHLFIGHDCADANALISIPIGISRGNDPFQVDGFVDSNGTCVGSQTVTLEVVDNASLAIMARMPRGLNLLIIASWLPDGWRNDSYAAIRTTN